MHHSLAAAAFVLASLALSPVAPACPEVNRYPHVLDGHISIAGGVVERGARAADDFNLPIGNSNNYNYNVRVIKFVMLSNFTITPTNVSGRDVLRGAVARR